MGEVPRPKSPPGYVELYSKRRQHAKLQILENEISYLQEELKSLEDVQPTSRSCKELNEYLTAKSDPLIAVGNQKTSKSDGSGKRTRSKSPWKCCLSGCCKTNEANNQQMTSKSCCCARDHCCMKCNGFKNLTCFPQNCCKFKLCSDCSCRCCC
ncbi:uncharacterized protein LOC141613638 isoform X2 [Silene latifolia]|uniref:uncharacterized protein LOC141613638 isoform X2 n=1 Tax=Silene latifolia TaxID=37657 RepID=UPI003D783EBC